MNLLVTTTFEADAQIRTIDDWWRDAFEILGRAPQIGRLYRRSPVPGNGHMPLTSWRYNGC